MNEGQTLLTSIALIIAMALILNACSGFFMRIL
jgi:PBP1b-binding outer membrane lipoprotein LpoB